MWVVCCWFSPLLREVLLSVLRSSPLLKDQRLQSPIRSGTQGRFPVFLTTPKCSVGKQITITITVTIDQFSQGHMLPSGTIN